MPDTPDQAFIKRREALKLYVYDDATKERWAPGKKVHGNLTCGWGHVCTKAEAHKYYHGFSEKEAQRLFDNDYSIAAFKVDRRKFPFTKPHQRGAIISMVFNAGDDCLNKSVGNYLKKADWVNTANAMSWYNRDNDSIELGLVRRRTHELIYFLTGVFPERWE